MLHSKHSRDPAAGTRPFCPKCAAQMWLARIEPASPGCILRTFECSKCNHVALYIYRDATDTKPTEDQTQT